MCECVCGSGLLPPKVCLYFVNLLMHVSSDMWDLFIEYIFVWVYVKCIILNMLHVSDMLSEATGSASCFGNVLMAQRAVARETQVCYLGF